VPLVEALAIVAVDAVLGTCALRGEILDMDAAGSVAVESSFDEDAEWTIATSALHLSTCKRVPLGRYTPEQPPSITARGTVAGVTRVQGGPLVLVDTSTGRTLETVPAPRTHSFRTGSGGSLLKNGASVEWHGAAVWCDPLPGRPASACVGWSPSNW
jgi:hypothetical protein